MNQQPIKVNIIYQNLSNYWDSTRKWLLEVINLIKLVTLLVWPKQSFNLNICLTTILSSLLKIQGLHFLDTKYGI